MKAICGKCNREFSFDSFNTNEDFIIVSCSECGQKNRIKIKKNEESSSNNNEYLDNPLNFIICSKCGNKNSNANTFCSKCGTALHILESESKTNVGKLENNKLQCINCGEMIASHQKYCPKCGKIIQNKENMVFEETYKNSPLSSSMDKTSSRESNISNVYPKASLGKRFGAMLLDILFSILLAIPGFLFLGAGENLKNSVVLIIGFVLLIIPLVYSFLKDSLGKGQSWGKQLTGLMVVNTELNIPCDRTKSFLRNLISGIIGGVPYLSLLTMWIDPIMVLATSDGRKVADRIVKTQVINLNDFSEMIMGK